MRAARILAAPLLLLALASCSDDEPSPPLDLADGPRSTGDADIPAGADPRSGDLAGVDLDPGPLDAERADQLARYLAAVGETIRTRVTSELFLDSTAAQQMDDRRFAALRAKRAGTTVPEVTVAYVAGVRDTVAGGVVAEVCVWQPSVAALDETTGEPVRPVTRRWTPRDVTMTTVDQRWLVLDEARGRFACDEEAP